MTGARWPLTRRGHQEHRGSNPLSSTWRLQLYVSSESIPTCIPFSTTAPRYRRRRVFGRNTREQPSCWFSSRPARCSRRWRNRALEQALAKAGSNGRPTSSRRGRGGCYRSGALAACSAEMRGSNPLWSSSRKPILGEFDEVLFEAHPAGAITSRIGRFGTFRRPFSAAPSVGRAVRDNVEKAAPVLAMPSTGHPFHSPRRPRSQLSIGPRLLSGPSARSCSAGVADASTAPPCSGRLPSWRVTTPPALSTIGISATMS
jgi:hypothetical protein